MRFEFATTSRIIFGQGTLKKVAPLAFKMGRRALLVTGRDAERSMPLVARLKETGLQVGTFRVAAEPTIDFVLEGLQIARKNNCDIVIGMGGGSVIDTAKAIAALLTNSGDIMDYLEVIGKGKEFTNAPAPCIAIPTTAGTGAEVTRNSVLTSQGHQVKVSMRSPMMLPDLAVIDPELTYTMSPAVTASTGLDALTQVLESYVSVNPNPLTDALCLDGLKRAARSLHRVFEDGNDTEARENMALVSLYGGLALANSKLGAVHGFAGPMGAMIPAPHGVICACLLPLVMEANISALQRHASQQYLKRYDDIAKILTNNPDARAEDGATWMHALCRSLQIPNLSSFGLTKDHFSELVSRSKAASSMKGNPVTLTDEELIQILRKSIS